MFCVFQSTPSAWRETPHSIPFPDIVSISIHSLRMEGDYAMGAALGRMLWISIHSLRMEGDWNLDTGQASIDHFNPLPPHGGRRFAADVMYSKLSISIHSLRMEGDIAQSFQFCRKIVFQSTPSAWRETVALVVVLPIVCAFQSTPSAWRETLSPAPIIRQFVISIHSLRMEGDPLRGTW